MLKYVNSKNLHKFEMNYSCYHNFRFLISALINSTRNKSNKKNIDSYY